MMKNKDEANHAMLENGNQDIDNLSKRISAVEQHILAQNKAMQQQFKEMENYCKFYRSLYSDLKVNFIHTKHVLLSKIAGSDDIDLSLQNKLREQESEKIKELQEEVQQLRLENAVLKAKLTLKGNQDANLQEESEVK